MSKTCPEKNPKSKDPQYICNPVTGNWIKKGADTHLKLIEKGILPQLQKPNLVPQEPKKKIDLKTTKKLPVIQPPPQKTITPPQKTVTPPQKTITPPTEKTNGTIEPNKPQPPQKIEAPEEKHHFIGAIEIIVQSPEYTEIKLPYQTALRAFRAMQKLHRREIGGSIYINMNKKFEYATMWSGQGGSVNFHREGEISYHTHPDSRNSKVYYDPPSFTDILNYVYNTLFAHFNSSKLGPQVSLVFTNEGVYVIQTDDPEKLIELVSPLGLKHVNDIVSALKMMWQSHYSKYMTDMMNKNIDRIAEINNLLKVINITFHPWTQIVKDRGLTLNIKLRHLVKKSYNPDVVEPETSPKPFIPPTIKPTQ